MRLNKVAVLPELRGAFLSARAYLFSAPIDGDRRRVTSPWPGHSRDGYNPWSPDMSSGAVIPNGISGTGQQPRRRIED